MGEEKSKSREGRNSRVASVVVPCRSCLLLAQLRSHEEVCAQRYVFASDREGYPGETDATRRIDVQITRRVDSDVAIIVRIRETRGAFDRQEDGGYACDQRHQRDDDEWQQRHDARQTTRRRGRADGDRSDNHSRSQWYADADLHAK
jgi:hypothetical protein